MLHKDYAIINLGFRFLVYPLNISFIRNLEPSHIGRWIKAGWGVDNTVLLEFSHMTIPPSGYPDRSPASSLFSGVIFAWNVNKYFRFVAFTKDYFRNIDQANLKIDCWHEQRHLRSAEEYIYDGTSPPTEEEVAEEELKHVYEQLGEDGVRARSNHVQLSMDRNKDADAIPGYVAVQWLREFFEYKIAHYRSKSIQIPVNKYTEGIKEVNGRMTGVVTAFYQKVLRIEPMNVFKYSVKNQALK